MSEYISVKVEDLKVILKRSGKHLTYDAIQIAETLNTQIKNHENMSNLETKVNNLRLVE